MTTTTEPRLPWRGGFQHSALMHADEDEFLTGTVPFGGDGYGEIIVKHITQPAPSPRSIIPTLSLAHEAVVRALEGKPPRKVIVVPQRIVNIVA